MGGTKKKPISAVEKAQAVASRKAEKKEKKGESAGGVKKLAQWTMCQLTEEQVEKALRPLKAITLYAASRALNLQPTLVNQLLRSLEAKGVVKKVGGYSGHYVYAFTS